MRIVVVMPADASPHQGNSITAARYAELFRELGCDAEVRRGWEDGEQDVLVALHARKSAESIARFASRRPDGRLVVVLTGTDLYGAGCDDPIVARSLALAARIVVLQAGALTELRSDLRARARVILQSAQPAEFRPERSASSFEVLQLAHLREVKDPLLAARASRRLPAESRVHVRHAGAALAPEWARRAETEMAGNPRYSWIGDVSPGRALHLLAAAHVFVQTSTSEGGSSALSEAIVTGAPILATRIPAAESLLGIDHPGLYPVRDEESLAGMLLRCEREPSFVDLLRERSVALAPGFTRDREREAWRDLLSDSCGGRRP